MHTHNWQQNYRSKVSEQFYSIKTSSDELKEVETSRWSKKDKLCVVMDDQL